MVAAVKGVEAQHEVVKNVLCMEGGQGETSYISNSQVQSRNLEMVVHVLKETLDEIRPPRRPEKLLTAADLGCSCGQNTIFVADVIVQHMTDLYTSRGHAPPEFSFYFSDLPSNDFNTLFKLLPDPATAGARPRYFAAGVPGSFHGRLFPERSIDAFTSTFSLHWLSQVPKEVVDKGSAAYNKRKVFVHGAPEATGLAYKRQFQSDLARFLRCRAAELKRGGAVFLVCLGRPSSATPTDQGTVRFLFGAMFQDSWDDLVGEGLMDGEKMDGFNVPVYAPTLEEFREVVNADGSFQINRLEMVTGSPPVVDHPDDPAAVGLTVANNERSLLGPLVDAHVGTALGGELFGRLRRRAEERAQELMEEMRFPHVVCSLSLASPRHLK
ncbi:indole-3-acetate O-methyltransferase 1-like isoform X1 [Panicum hallii]|uniref:indole-3-acetate O-methyltransferase 1-like isoform X1 n=1 Tax=Panicum hallii TaxID=206008 RepID=UPI000DF4D738|nr:indole-3-acetate O-methyltransferase 1-like isoform X1 [Panicum hallii]